MIELENMGTAVGLYNNLSTSIDTNVVVTQLIDGLTMTKAADRTSWSTGNLTYTLTVDNQGTLTFENPIVTDILDPALITLVAGSVKIDGVDADPTDYTYDAVSGVLEVTLADILPTEQRIITFQVEKI